MAINPLQIPGYAAPQQVDFSSLAQLPQVYQKAQADQVRRDTLASLGQGGQVDPMKLITSGDMNLANMGIQMQQHQAAAARQASQDAYQRERAGVEDKFRSQQLGQTANYQNAQLAIQRDNQDYSPQERAQLAPQYGLQPGAPGFKEWVLTGKLPDTSPPTGFERLPDNTYRAIPGGPQDPEFQADVAKRSALAKGDVPQAVYPGAEFIVPNKAADGPLYKVPQAASDATGGLSPEALDIKAAQWINGDYEGATKNVGRGAQGGKTLEAIANRAAIKLIEQGHTPEQAAALTSANMQKFRASGIYQNTESRTGASREANLNIILKAADAAIPAALEASEKVSRTGWVPINQIIQKGQVMASNPDLRQFGMANLQLAEHWARAMNPTGVMRESDRDMALHFLSLADSKETYKQAVGQLKLQITRERDAIRSSTPGHAAPAAPVGPAAPVVIDGYTIKQN